MRLQLNVLRKRIYTKVNLCNKKVNIFHKISLFYTYNLKLINFQYISYNNKSLLWLGGHDEMQQDIDDRPNNDAVIVDDYESDDGDGILLFLEKGSKASYAPKRKSRKVLTESSVIKQPEDQIKLGKLCF